MISSDSRTIGLIPAAGRASRLAPLPMSKELYPIGFSRRQDGAPRPKVASQYLLESMVAAGIREAFMVLRPGKWDIPAYFGDGTNFGMRLAYLATHVPFGVPFTADQAFPFIRGLTVALGFPDILFTPADAYGGLLRRLRLGKADVVVGLFPTQEPQNVGVVELDERGRVWGIYEKSNLSHLPYMWAMAVWRPKFTEFLHDHTDTRLRILLGGWESAEQGLAPGDREVPMGDVIHAAIEAGLVVEAETFPEGRCVDIGTPESLHRVVEQEALYWSAARG
jgi:glucose-1-phosphate thymidylyltransferase